MRNLKIPFLCKLVLQSVNFSVLTLKIFVTSDAACLSRNIYSRTVSVQKQGLHYSEDLFDRLFLSAGRASSPSLVHREKLKILPPSHKLKTEKTNTLIFVPLFYFSK